MRTRGNASNVTKLRLRDQGAAGTHARGAPRTQGLLHGTDTRHGRSCDFGVQPLVGDATRMSQLASEPDTADQSQLSRLCVAIRGKLQFMDYLVRAALADAERYRAENDPGTRIFIRQLVEMHAANLRLESQNMRLVGDVCEALEAIVDGSADRPDDEGDLP